MLVAVPRRSLAQAVPADFPTTVMVQIPGAVTYYTAAGAPNPAFVEMFAAEKAINLLSIAHVIDLGGGTNYHRTNPAYATKNPAGGTPYLEFEDGTVVSETVTLCELLDSTCCRCSLFCLTRWPEALVSAEQ